MKKIFVYLSVLLLIASCDVKVSKNSDENNENLPEYEEYYAEDTTETTIQQELPVSNEQMTEHNVQTFTLSTDNLNSLLASPEQKVIFSFKTENGKTLSLITDENDNYLIYRYGTPANIELQYPENVDNTSWEKFYFEGYKTDNTDLMHVIFNNYGTEYTVFYNKFSKTPEDNQIGVIVKTGSNKVRINGVFSSQTGSMDYFRHSDKISKTR